MARELKDPKIRRKEIIDVAYNLFEEKGYENTSVENIINAAKIAKGTFYYYFETKRELLDEIANEISHKIHSLIEGIAKSQTLSALEKLDSIFTSAEKNIIINSNVMAAIHNTENRELQEKLNVYYVKRIIPLITDVFNQGCNEGLWRKRVSLPNMQIILGGTQFILDSGLFVWCSQKRGEFILEIEKLLECSIDAEPGALRTIFKKL